MVFGGFISTTELAGSYLLGLMSSSQVVEIEGDVKGFFDSLSITFSDSVRVVSVVNEVDVVHLVLPYYSCVGRGSSFGMICDDDMDLVSGGLMDLHSSFIASIYSSMVFGSGVSSIAADVAEVEIGRGFMLGHVIGINGTAIAAALEYTAL